MFDDPSNKYDQLAAVVPLVRIHTNFTVAFDGMLMMLLRPLDCTVTTPVELFVMV
jgi:hypothetical protein